MEQQQVVTAEAGVFLNKLETVRYTFEQNLDLRFSGFCHAVEALLGRVLHSGKQSAIAYLINLVLATSDHINTLLQEQAVKPVLSDRAKLFVKELQEGAVVPAQTTRKPSSPDMVIPVTIPLEQTYPPGRLITYQIHFHPSAQTLQALNRPQQLLQELQALGTINVYSHHGEGHQSEGEKTGECKGVWDLYLTTDQGIKRILDVFFFVLDAKELALEGIVFWDKE